MENQHLRKCGNKIWNDPTLEKWPKNDYRIFCGNLGNDVTDNILYKSFDKFKTIQKVKIIYDKLTGKSKGYGFVSFKSPQDMLTAIKTMNGQYIGSRPAVVTKSKYKDRDLNPELDNEKNKTKFKKVKKISKQSELQN